MPRASEAASADASVVVSAAVTAVDADSEVQAIVMSISTLAARTLTLTALASTPAEPAALLRSNAVDAGLVEIINGACGLQLNHCHELQGWGRRGRRWRR